MAVCVAQFIVDYFGSPMASFFDEVECSEEEKPRNPELVVIGIIYVIIVVALIYSYEHVGLSLKL